MRGVIPNAILVLKLCTVSCMISKDKRGPKFQKIANVINGSLLKPTNVANHDTVAQLSGSECYQTLEAIFGGKHSLREWPRVYFHINLSYTLNGTGCMNSCFLQGRHNRLRIFPRSCRLLVLRLHPGNWKVHGENLIQNYGKIASHDDSECKRWDLELGV